MTHRKLLTAAILVGLSLPALAQDGGYAGSTVGLTASGVPSNPFASNYPSAPTRVVEGRERRIVRRPARDPALLPPGRIPR